MKFNIIMEDGGVLANCVVLVDKGLAESKRDVYIAIKYQGGICICNKRYLNYWVDSKDFYEVEEIKKPILEPIVEDLEEEEEDNENLFEIPEGTINLN